MDKGTFGARRQIARERILIAAGALGERFGLKEAAARLTTIQARDPQIRHLFELEIVADLLDGVLQATEAAPQDEAETCPGTPST
jgi:hypothetical protein